MKELFSKNRALFIISCVSAAFVVAIIVVMGIIFISRDTKAPEPEIPRDTSSIMDNKADINGVWIASVFNINYPSRADLDEDSLKAEIDKIVETTKNAGFNAIFFQVRPESDALYKSDIFPPSRYMSSNDQLTLDALEYVIDAAHKEDIEVHAWVNPVRISSKSTVTIDSLADLNPAKKNPEYTVKYGDGKLYYNLGIPAVRELICLGVAEIVEKYDVDGIVFDDYFYPYPSYYNDEETGERKIAEFEDRDAYKKYNSENLDITDWRRNNVNLLVESVYETVKSIDKECLFGVSPFGIWKNGDGGESGSLTAGTESYYSLYCDSVSWIKGEYIDYIAPQIYWTNESSAAPYDKICDWWADRVEGTKVRLLISHGAYRYENDWETPFGIMSNQVEYAAGKSLYKGSLFYGYKAIANNINGLCDELTNLYKNQE